MLQQTHRAFPSPAVVIAAPLLALVAGLLAFAAGPAAAPARVVESAFAAENRVAMDTMMRGMHVAPSGNVDRDFAVMMIAHHQGAIDMALAELRHGRNERLRRIAQGIVVAQQQEIAAMRAVIDEELPTAGLAPEQAVCRAPSTFQP